MKKNKIVLNLLLVAAISIFCNTRTFAAESSSVEAVEYYNAGIEYVMQEDYNLAATAFQRAIEYDPELVDAYYNLGSLYEHFNDLETALKIYTELIAIEPRDYETIYKVGDLYNKLGFKEEALEYLNAIPRESAIYGKAEEYIKSINTNSKIAAKNNETKVTYNNAPTNQGEGISEKSMEGRTAKGGYTDPEKTLLNKYPSPTGIATDKYGNIFIASYSDNAIYIVTPDEKNHVFSNSSMLDGPIGLASDGKTLYVANYNKDNILKISPDGNVSIYKNNVVKPYALSIMNNVLYVSEQGSNSVIKFQLK